MHRPGRNARLTVGARGVFDGSMFLFETLALILCVTAVAFAHVADRLVARRCPRCRLPAEESTGRAVVHADAPETFESWEPGRPALALVTSTGLVPVVGPSERPVSRTLQRRETLTSHRCRVCRHTWQTGDVEVVRGAGRGAVSAGESPGESLGSGLANVRVFPRRPS